MLSNLQRRKVTLLFLILDRDENGYIERWDFQRVAHDLAAIRDHTRYSDEYREFQTIFMAIFESIQQMMDSNNNQQVELPEWVAYFERVLDDTNQYAERVAPLASGIFTLLDHDGDGAIQVEEFRHFTQVYRLIGDDINVNERFKTLDLNGNGRITRDEFGYLITDFFLSDDPQKPGNYIFGPI